MKRTFLLISLLSLMASGFACTEQPISGGGTSPTDAYQRLFAAVKAKDTEAIKSNMTKTTQQFAEFASKKNNKPIEEVYENGFTATTMSPTLPQIRDERISENMGAIEVWSSRDSRWEDLPFILEDGAWKLAIGEMFAGSYKSPGKGRDRLEKEAANTDWDAHIQAADPSLDTNMQPVAPGASPPAGSNTKPNSP
jgi:hypothetical protein